MPGPVHPSSVPKELARPPDPAGGDGIYALGEGQPSRLSSRPPGSDVGGRSSVLCDSGLR